MLRNRLISTLLAGAAASTLMAVGLAGRAAAQADPQTPAPPPNPPTSTAAPAAPVVTVSGNLETYYTLNFNDPDSRSNGFIFNDRDREFGLNYVDLRIGKAATPESRAGFFIRLIEGDVKRIAIAPDDSDTDNLHEAYGTLLVPVGGRDLKVDAGQFVTHVGYETIDIGTNNFFSRSFLFAIPTPFYNAGVRATLPLGARTTFTGLLLNRFNGRSDPNNKDLAAGFQLVQTLSPSSSLILNGLTSRETVVTEVPDVFLTGQASSGADGEASRALRRPVAGLRARRPTRQVTTVSESGQDSVLDLIYTNQTSATTKLAIEGIYRFGDLLEDIYGVAGYGVLTLGNGNNLGLRAEFLKQKNVDDFDLDGAGDDLDLFEATLSYELRSPLFAGARTFVEFRYDHANEQIFSDKDGVSDSQFTLTLGQVFGF